MYYYYDKDHTLQGPFSESAYAKWFVNGYMPAGTELFDRDHQPCLIEDVVRQSFKSRTKVMFCEESFSLDSTCDRTELDVTLNLENCDSCDASNSSEDFTQLEEGVDEVDCGEGSEKDAKSTHLQRMVNIYMDRRPMNDQRRLMPDTYVPFEHSWALWTPYLINLNNAIRGAVHVQNQLQYYNEHEFSEYLENLNIKPHQCDLCHISFTNSYKMLTHFLSVIHINRTYRNDGFFSMIDINCVLKMMSEFESDTVRGSYWTRKGVIQEKENHSFFDDVDLTTAFESMKSTISLLQTVPLLNPPQRSDSADSCEYIEFIIFLRDFEEAYSLIKDEVRNRRFGSNNKTIERKIRSGPSLEILSTMNHQKMQYINVFQLLHCVYCDIDFDCTVLDSFPKHLLSAEHIHQALDSRVSRKDMEFWISFLNCLQRSNRNHLKKPKSTISLQEGDFPLCYILADVIPDDVVYSGHEVEQVLNFAREQVRTSGLLLEDIEYRTSCRWCHVSLYTRNTVIHHVLYDKCHRNHLRVISNDDLRRFFRLLGISITLPLFRFSFGASSKPNRASPNEKEIYIQRLQNYCYRVHKQRGLRQIAARSFPFGLGNRCELCEENIEHVNGLLTHFCSKKHTQNMMSNARFTKMDFECWLTMFNVRIH